MSYDHHRIDMAVRKSSICDDIYAVSRSDEFQLASQSAQAHSQRQQQWAV